MMPPAHRSVVMDAEIDVDLEKRVPGFALEVAFRNAAGITALFGRSGSGKSMTLGLIAGLSRPDRGHVRVGDVTLIDTAAPLHLPTHKRRVGLVFQDAQLFPHLTVRQNLLFGRWFAPKAKKSAEALAVDFDAVIETLGIGGLMARRPAKLSGGERQRVAIGRALLACPRLLLLDEPLAALDRPRKLEILPLIERLRDVFAIPTIYVYHAIEEVVRLAGHVVVLDAGKVSAQGDPVAVFGSARVADEPRFGRATVLEVTAGTQDAAYGLTALHHSAGTLWMAGLFGPPGRRVRALIRATDVSLATGATAPISIRSALAGTVAGIEADGALAMVEVSLSGGSALTALVTRRAVDDLGLRVGSPVNALVKTVALDEGTVSA